MNNNKVYKSFFINIFRMFPSDPKGSLDDFIILNFYNNHIYQGVFYGNQS